MALWAGASSALAQQVYESFNYTPGSALDAKINPGSALPWSAMSADAGDDNILINGSNLSYPGLANPSGASVTYDGTGKSERLSLGGTISSGAAYYSFLLQLNSLGNMSSSTPVFIAGFSNRTGGSDLQPTTVGTRLYLRQSNNPGFFNIGVSKNSSNINDIAFDGGDYSPGTPLLIVGSYEINPAGGTDDIARLYINPSSLGADVAPAENVTAPQTGTDLFDAGSPAVAGFVLRQAVATVPGVQIDELRVDSTWAQVTPPVGVAWTVDSDGSWSSGGNWSTFAAPNDPAAFVNFPAVISTARTVTLDSPVALRTINFTSPVAYTIVGGDGQPLQFSGSAAINVMAGNHTIAAPVSIGGSSFLASVASGSSLTLTRDLVAPAAGLTKAGAGTLMLPRAQVDQLTVAAGTMRIVPNGGASEVSRTRLISFPGGGGNGKLDLNDNDLIIAAGGTPLGTLSGTTYSGITGMIQRGRNGAPAAGNWSGSGIVTSQPDAIGTNHRTSLGIATAAQSKKIGDFETAVWNGQTVTGGDTLVMYTYTGDATLDGKINIDDYMQIDNGIASGETGWFNGDFNYDGKVNIDDYMLIDFGISTQGPPLGSGSSLEYPIVAVPEPAMTVALAGLAMFFRRVRRADHLPKEVRTADPTC